jgi:hypothetical protein
MVTGFHHQDNQDTVIDLPSAVFVSLLKPSVEVLRQYSLPNMDLRRVTYLIIALPPNHETTSVYVSFNVPVRPPFRRCLPRWERADPALRTFVPFRSPLTVLEGTPLRDEVTEGCSGGCIELWIYEFLMSVERLRCEIARLVG